MTSQDNQRCCHDGLGGHGILKNYRKNRAKQRPRFCSTLYKISRFENAQDFHRGCHGVLGGQGILKKQKFVENCAKPQLKVNRNKCFV